MNIDTEQLFERASSVVGTEKGGGLMARPDDKKMTPSTRRVQPRLLRVTIGFPD